MQLRLFTLQNELDDFAGVRRIVVKVGSALLTDPTRGLAREKIRQLCSQIVTALGTDATNAQQRQVVLVSSGAIAEGCARLGWEERPNAIYQLQAAAAVGQMGLVQAYENAFLEHDRRAAMVMLTHDDLADRQRYLNARATIGELLKQGVVPVINENDTVATEEIHFGDNDTLAALVTNLVEADLLVILTDVPGLMDADPTSNADARLVQRAQAGDPSLDALPSAKSGVLGRGGMVTKLRAAKLAARSGAHTVIASGKNPQVLTELLQGKLECTWLTANMTPMTARKRWIAGHLRAKGTLTVDAGAAQALRHKGVSLLAVGLKRVSGKFARGDVVRIQDLEGGDVAQGLSNYAHDEVAQVLGRRSEEFQELIGFEGEPELVHRDNLVLL